MINRGDGLHSRLLNILNLMPDSHFLHEFSVTSHAQPAL